MSDETRSGGVDINSGIVATDGGDIVGKDKYIGGNVVTLSLDKSYENIVDILKMQLNEKKNEILELRKENQELRCASDQIGGAFEFVKLTLGDHSLSIHHFIIHICYFLKDKELGKDFLDSLPNLVHKAAKKHD